MVQWLGVCAFTLEGLGSIPGQGTKILQEVQCGQKKKKKGNSILSTESDIQAILSTESDIQATSRHFLFKLYLIL